MVFREGTVVQIRHVMNEMERSLNLDGLEKSVARTPKPTSKNSTPSRTPSVQERKEEQFFLPENGSRSCMGNHLFKSVFKCRFKKVKLLLDKGFNVNTKNDYGYNVLVAALHIESEIHRGKMFKFLLDRQADPLGKDPKYERTVLSWACLLGRLNEVVMIFQRFKGEFDLVDKDKDGMTALHHATQGGHLEVVRAVVQEMRRFRLSVDIPDKLGLSPYLHARRLGFTEIAEVLREEAQRVHFGNVPGPRSASEPSYSDSGLYPYQKTKSQLIPNSTLSLLDMTSKGRTVQNFKQSELDTSKVYQNHKHTHGSMNISSMMTALAEQQSGSFRPTARVKTPEPEIVTTQKKRSTLAILFGKERKKKPSRCNKRGSARNSASGSKGILKKK
ncbi:hypothetical protein KUTeg_004605 [Tegillarca granosa]|uniref:Uncharacterized protein n=1 Tax=Tegillarca granosa TaxID=220873 RepID=A0ABQ9FQD6_TEGGR|nr:hypothetical protein KUTeg_004605 [Tegillarca granosa]